MADTVGFRPPEQCEKCGSDDLTVHFTKPRIIRSIQVPNWSHNAGSLASHYSCENCEYIGELIEVKTMLDLKELLEEVGDIKVKCNDGEHRPLKEAADFKFLPLKHEIEKLLGYYDPDNPVGLWVIRRSDSGGGSTELGIFEGHLLEILLKLSHYGGGSLSVSPFVPTEFPDVPRRSVIIMSWREFVDIDINTIQILITRK